MPEDTEQEEVKLPSEANAVVGEFPDRPAAERAVEGLVKGGFRSEQVSFVAKGAETVDGVFHPGVIKVTVHPEGREREAEEMLRRLGAAATTTGKISATGDVIEEGLPEREEATSS